MHPPIPNLTLRQFAGESDYAKIAAVTNACADNDPMALADTAETVANRYTNLVNCDPFQDMIIAEVDGEMVGYARGVWNDEPASGRLYHFSLIIKPAWRGRGIAEMLMQWMERHLRQMVDKHGTADRAFLCSFQTDAEKENTHLLEGAGYLPHRQFLGYVRQIGDDLPDVELPDGIELRPATPDQYCAVWQVWDEVLQDTIGYSPLTEEQYHAFQNNTVFFQPNLWQIAWDKTTNQIAGFAINFEEKVENARFNRKRASNYDLGVRRSWRRRGLARALTLQSLHSFRAIGMTEATLGIEATTYGWAKPLLEQNGFVVGWSNTDYRRPLS